MKILTSIKELSMLKGPIVLAAGTFDGLHLGHQKLIRRAIELALEIGGTPVVMTFDRHPASLIRPEVAPSLLTTINAKLQILDQMGVPFVLLIEFNTSFASIRPDEFIRMMARSANPLAMICVGSQWFFGKGGGGNINMLARMGAELGFSVSAIDPVIFEGEPISSTRIREAIARGDFSTASSCLGRNYVLSGYVVSGAGLGRQLGFPTANLDVQGMQLPPDGVYAVNIREGERLFSGVANIGHRPTVDPSLSMRTAEFHLFDFSENLVGKKLDVVFVHYLREERKFGSLAALAEQISIDSESARIILSCPD